MGKVVTPECMRLACSIGLVGWRPSEEGGADGAQVSYFQQLKTKGIPIVMLTAYDATTARIAEQAGIQVLLVGDTLGMVVQGMTPPCPSLLMRCSTIPV